MLYYMLWNSDTYSGFPPILSQFYVVFLMWGGLYGVWVGFTGLSSFQGGFLLSYAEGYGLEHPLSIWEGSGDKSCFFIIGTFCTNNGHVNACITDCIPE